MHSGNPNIIIEISTKDIDVHLDKFIEKTRPYSLSHNNRVPK